MKIKIWLACFLLCLVRAAAGEVSVTTLAVRGEWATLRIGNLPAGTVEVAVRDERGGPVFSRGVESDRGAVLMPVPTVAVAGLGEREWAVEVISRDAGGEMLQKARASVSAGGSARAMAAPAGVALRPGPFLPQSEVVEVAPEEMERAPAAALAGFASVYFPESLAAKLGQERVMAVVAAGTQVLIGGEKQPLGGLSRLTWTRIEMDSGTAWLCTSVAPPPLRLLTADVPRLEP
ncbi:MAG TPA: hypothetical protein VHM90_04205, partial [Phycisphaerae bacterium]|nr:hypothetical protein [Phycisphaerae bacterium]